MKSLQKVDIFTTILSISNYPPPLVDRGSQLADIDLYIKHRLKLTKVLIAYKEDSDILARLERERS